MNITAKNIKLRDSKIMSMLKLTSFLINSFRSSLILNKKTPAIPKNEIIYSNSIMLIEILSFLV